MPPTGPGEEVRLRAAVESSPSGLLVVDATGSIVLVNRETERLFGYDRSELLGQPIELLVPARYREHHPAFRSGFVDAPRARAMGAGRDLHGRRKDGSEVPVEIGLTPVETDEGLYIISSVVDISARKAAEAEQRRLEEELRQSQKLEAVGRLAGGIAHDFNNILGMIVGFAELASNPEADRAQLQADLGEILAAANRGRDLVQRILRFSRRQAVSLQPINLSDVVQEIVALLRSTIPANFAIEVGIGDRLPMIMGDAVSIHQVLMNLANNAVDAMPSGGALHIHVDRFYARDSFVRTHPGLREGHYVRLAVRDTGVGMDPKTLDRAFEPFFTTKPPGRGTGLGLSMVHGIMSDLGGTVLLDSAPGRGTTVSCLLPLSEDAVLDDSRGTGDIQRETPSGDLILLVDDEAGLLRVNSRRLASLGFRVISQQQPASALAWLEGTGELPAAVITDYSMPGMDGVEFARQVHGRYPALPIVLVTGYMEHFAEADLRHHGIVEVLTKPLTTAEFHQAVRAAIDPA